jgi:hypothetical protein
VRTHHPRVTIRVNDSAAAIAPKHIHHRILGGRAEFGRFLDYFEEPALSAWRPVTDVAAVWAERRIEKY